MNSINDYNKYTINGLKTSIRNSKLILFGASDLGSRLLKDFLINNIDVLYFCDNNMSKWGSNICGVEIISPDKLTSFSKDTHIIISSMYYDEIGKQLDYMGFINVYMTVLTEVRSSDGNDYSLLSFYNYINTKNILKVNSKFKNINQANRAFLIATGPSIKMEDLSLLQGEDCYSLSNFFLHKDLDKIKPIVHFFAPYHKPLIFENYIEWLKTADIKLPRETEIILEINSKMFIEAYGIFTNRNVYYLKFSEHLYNDNIDITKAVLAPQTGPIMILPVLIYMGYSKIYLLGCDHTVLRDYGRMTTNFYPKEEDIRINATSEEAWFGIIEYLEATKLMFLQYRHYRDAIGSSPTKIINLSRDSWLDLFQFDTLTEVIKND